MDRQSTAAKKAAPIIRATLPQLGRFGCRLWARAFEHQRNSRPAIAGREDRPLRVPTARARAEFEYLAEQIYAAIRGMAGQRTAKRAGWSMTIGNCTRPRPCSLVSSV
jgi:hypothetical protein